MASPSAEIVERMAAQGFITVGAASNLTGLPPSSIRDLTKKGGGVRSCRVRRWVFVELETLKDAVGPLFVEKAANERGQAGNSKGGGTNV